MDQTKIKRHLFAAYGGFADKRVKDLDKGNLFIVDDRGVADIGADKHLYPWFCMIFARVLNSGDVQVSLMGNVPMSPEVREWASGDSSVSLDAGEGQLAITLDVRETGRLTVLASMLEAIVRPGAPRYSERSYKYVCPRSAGSLRKLAGELQRIGTSS